MLDIRRDSGTVGTYHFQSMTYIDQGIEMDIREEMKTSSKKPIFSNKASTVEWYWDGCSRRDENEQQEAY